MIKTPTFAKQDKLKFLEHLTRVNNYFKENNIKKRETGNPFENYYSDYYFSAPYF
jgi:hypothetical protein